MGNDKLVIQTVQEEELQFPETRASIYRALKKEFGVPVISFFTSFKFPVMIEDSDADMLEGLLQKIDLSKGFVLLLSSPGGDGLAAERVINICRAYSGTNDYKVIVPSKAKSAATMICLGASEILMTKTSELGPIDPQFLIVDKEKTRRFSVFNIIKSYEILFNKAVKEKGNIQPYLQQLSNYDAREIEEFKAAMSLSEDIAVKVLKTGMLKNISITEIKKKIKGFLTPEQYKTHGRPIYYSDAQKCGLIINILNEKSNLWGNIYELYIRLNNFISGSHGKRFAKCIETERYSFTSSVSLKNREREMD